MLRRFLQMLKRNLNEDFIRELKDWTIPDDVMKKIARLPVLRYMDFVKEWRKANLSHRPVMPAKPSRLKKGAIPPDIRAAAEEESNPKVDRKSEVFRKWGQFRERSHPGRDSRNKHGSNMSRNRQSTAGH